MRACPRAQTARVRGLKAQPKGNEHRVGDGEPLDAISMLHHQRLRNRKFVNPELRLFLSLRSDLPDTCSSLNIEVGSLCAHRWQQIIV